MILLLLLFLIFTQIEAPAILIDQIETLVCGAQENTPITFTEAQGWKRSLNGEMIPFEQQVRMKIVAQQSKEDHMQIDEDYALRYLDSIKTTNNLTDEDLNNLFAEVGLLYEEGVAQLLEQYIYDMFLYHKFKSRVLVTDDQVQEFYKNNPDIIPAVLEIKIATVPYDQDTKDAINKKLDTFLGGDQSSIDLSWSDVIELVEGDLSADKKFITSMKTGEMYVFDNQGEFDIYWLIRKTPARTKDLNERRSEIVDLLTKQGFEILLKEYNDQNQNKVRVVQVG